MKEFDRADNLKRHIDKEHGIEELDADTKNDRCLKVYKESYRPDQISLDSSQLLHAAHVGNVTLVQILIAKGVDILTASATGKTALHVAASGPHEEVVVFLLESGTPIDIRDHEGRTPLHDAVLADTLEMATLLLNLGAYLNSKDTRGREPLHYVRSNVLWSFLLKRGANPDATDMDRRKPLNTILSSGPEALACELLETAASIDHHQDSKGRSALHQSSELQKHTMLEVLLRKGLDVNTQDQLGTTPLHLASACNDTKSMAMLLKAGAQASALNVKGESPLFVAVSRGSKDAVRLFVWYGDERDEDVRLDALSYAIEQKNASMVKFIIDQGADVKARVRGESLLHRGIRAGSYQIVKLLIDGGANVNQENVCWWTRRPLHFILSQTAIPRVEKMKIIHLLIDSGADIHLCNVDLETPLHCASRLGYLAAVERLIELGADVNAKSVLWPAYPIMEALCSGHIAIVQRLLQAGADVKLRNWSGASALDTAKRRGHQDIVELLENHISSIANAAKHKIVIPSSP